MIMKGQKINDRYQIVKAVGEGGMANVYLAYDTILDRNVAVKILRGDLASDEKFVRRFQREALSSSSLSHPNIVEVYDVGEDNGNYYIVMEFIEGKHLKNLVKKRGKLTTSEVIDIMLQITDGLSVAHDSYLIHRDIKPQNIMILENGLVKITDFGIAMAINNTQLTQTNSVMGSVHYLPPEQASGKGSTLKSDIYSMGILMYELLTGKLPYRGDNAVEIALKHLKEPLPSIKEELPELPQSIANIIIRSTSKNPENRYTDAREMHEDLATCMDESRADEPVVKLKHSEAEYDEKAKKKTIKELESSVVDDKNEVIAKKVKDSDSKQEKKTLVLLASVFTGLVVVITTIVVLFMLLSNSDEIEIPDVSGLSFDEAVDKLQSAGFEISEDQREVISDEVDAGDVVRTNPVAGERRTEGTDIVLYISIGDGDKYIMEDLAGENYLTVMGKLEALGINVLLEKKDIPEADADKYETNEIIEFKPEVDTELSKGDQVTIYIPNIIITYPDFVGEAWTEDEVMDFADEHGIRVTVSYVETTSAADGVVVFQNRAAGVYTVTANGTLTIEVAKLPEDDTTVDDCKVTGLC